MANVNGVWSIKSDVKGQNLLGHLRPPLPPDQTRGKEKCAPMFQQTTMPQV